MISSDEEAAANDFGAWFASLEYLFGEPDGGRTSSKSQFYYDGKVLAGVTADIQQGVLRPKDPCGEFGTEMVLRGMSVDIGLSTPAGMLDARNLQIIACSMPDGVVTVQGLVHCGWEVHTIRCELVADRGFLPRRIEFRDPILNSLERVLEASAFERFAGCDLPVAGTCGEFEPDWEAPNVRARYNWIIQGMMAVAKHGRVDPLEEKQYAIGRERALIAFGEGGPPIRRRGNEIRVRYPRVWGVNEPFPQDKATFTFPPGWKYLNAFEDIDAKGEKLYDPKSEIIPVNDPARVEIDRSNEAVGGMLNVLPLGPQDFGLVAVGQTVTRRFQVTNKCAMPVRLSISKKSCACTEVSIERATLPVGESTHVTMSTTAPGLGQLQRLGAVLRAERAEPGEPAPMPAAAPVAAAPASEVVLDMMFTPEISFDLLRDRAEFRCVAGTDLKEDLRIIQRTAGELKINSVTSTIPELKVQGVRTSTVNEYVHIADLTAKVERPGRYCGVVNWQTSSTSQAKVQTRVALVVLPKVYAEPANMVVDSSEEVDVQSVDFKISARLTGAALRFGVTVDPPVDGLSVEFPGTNEDVVVAAGEPGTLKVRIERSKLKGLLGGSTLRLREVGGEVQCEIPIVWMNRKG